MSADSKVQIRWLAAVTILSVLNVGHALYFDWSDAYVHAFLGALCVLVAIRWPMAAAASIGLIVLLVFLTSAFLWDPPESMEQVRVGDRWPEVQERFGAPTYKAATFAEARQIVTGYSVPSPVRFHHGGPVAIFVDGEYALWVFHDGKTVTDTFVGGS